MKIEQKAVNNIRVISAQIISKANSGHTGIALDMASLIYSLYSDCLQVLPETSENKHLQYLRDRFVLSAGHGSASLYTTLNAFGFNITNSDLLKFRNSSKTPGHPELNISNGIEYSAGPLGQGVASAVGMALAEKILADKFNKPNLKLFDYKVYTFLGEGCLMEGVCFEALSFAGAQKLNNFIAIYDCNKVTLDSDISLTMPLNVKEYVASLGFNVFEIKNSEDLFEINNVLNLAKKSDKPSFIIYNSQIGFGTKYINLNKAHGLVLKDDEIKDLCNNLQIPYKKEIEFCEDVANHFKKLNLRYKNIENQWALKNEKYKNLYPNDYKKLIEFFNPDFSNINKLLSKLDEPISASSREMGGIILNEIGKYYDTVIGGTADVSSSTKASIKNSNVVSSSNYNQKNILFGVREFAMGCITNGLALSGFTPFCSTFLVFSDYMKSAIRSACLMNLPIIYIFTHDSVCVGEDGPTHQPIEQIVSLNSIPNLMVFRPSNFEECKFAYSYATQNKVPTAIILSRQTLQIVPNNKNIERGGYIISPENKTELQAILLASGSEVGLCINAQKKLFNLGINSRVVSMPCTKLYDMQNLQYKNCVIKNDFKNIISVEAGSSINLQKYVGNGFAFGINEFGFSMPGSVVYNTLGFNENNIIKIVKDIINKNSK